MMRGALWIFDIPRQRDESLFGTICQQGQNRQLRGVEFVKARNS